jgi:hypothetical protein
MWEQCNNPPIRQDPLGDLRRDKVVDDERSGDETCDEATVTYMSDARFTGISGYSPPSKRCHVGDDNLL